MKIKDKFLLQLFADQWVAVSERTYAEGNIVISLNSLGAFLWEQLQEDREFEALLQSVLDNFSVEESVARTDLEKFIHSLEVAGLLTDE